MLFLSLASALTRRGEGEGTGGGRPVTKGQEDEEVQEEEEKGGVVVGRGVGGCRVCTWAGELLGRSGDTLPAPRPWTLRFQSN